MTVRPARFRLLLGTFLALGACSKAAAAPKTDVVVLRNGDRITCEIDRLDRGRLRVETDDIGTIEVEWDVVDSLRADATFEVEDLVGRQYFGSLGQGPRGGTVRVEGNDSVVALEMPAVIRISRLGEKFWSRLDGAVDLSTSYASANELFTLDLTAEATYERPRFEVGANLSANVSDQPEAEESRRWNAAVEVQNRRPSRWFGFGQALLEQNRELGYELRGSLAAGAGRYLFQRPHDDFMAGSGLTLNREAPVDGSTTTGSELLVTGQYDRFFYNFPKVDILVTLTGYASLSDWGRTRLEADARLKRELFKDFNLTFRGYESFDSRPATEGAARNDYGTTFGIGWSF